MRRSMLGAAAALMLAGPVTAQTPAERAGQSLESAVTRDRFRDAAEAARDADIARSLGGPPPLPRVQQLEEDRAGLQPDVGRPEQRGWLPNSQRTTGADRNVIR